MSINNLTPYKPGQSGNPAGKPKGTKNRSTIFREFLESPDDDGLTREQKMIKAVYMACVEKGDVSALKEFMDSAYGKNTDKQEVDMTANISWPLPQTKLDE